MSRRPEFENIKSGKEFRQWYWLKDELVSLCKMTGLKTTGRKSELMNRIQFSIDNEGQRQTESSKKKALSKFNWAKASLSLSTVITDNVSFGPNFRNFMKKHIGPGFSCHSDFMEWVKSNTGKTLEDSLIAYKELELRKKDPNFKREIATNNMFNQYTRDFIEDNPGAGLKEARKHWMKKKHLPTKDGFIRYDRTDLNLA